MTRFVVGPDVVLRLAREGVTVDEEHRLVAPTLLRSQLVAMLYEAAQRGELTRDEADDHLAYFRGLGVRLLGDRVLQRRSWTVAGELGWDSTYDAEYIALTQLQADAFVTLDPRLAQDAATLVEVAQFEDLC